MFLKRLEISGFKSFAEKTVLDFEGKDGKITSIVGPNGSGKSNIVDAVRWVLGEQSYKLMRSKKSEDVVFFGSTGKSKGSAAQVSMTLDNTNGHIPIDFSELTITRKVYRSGESEYLINRSKVRLIDIHELLSKCGFGQTTYTVLGQGMVDQLLFYGPSERKVLFDEAAGVKKYQIKREQSIKKLEATDRNLIRLKDILSELAPRVENLKRLVKRAEGRGSLEEELKELQNKFYSAIYLELETKSNSLNEKKNNLNQQIKAIENEIKLLSEKIGEKSFTSPYDLDRRDLEVEIQSLSLKRDEFLKEVAFTQGQIDQERNKSLSTENLLKELEKEEKELDEKIPFLQDKTIVGKAEISDVEEAIKKLQKDLEKIENKIGDLNKGLSQNNETENGKEILALEKILLEKKEEEKTLKNNLQELKQKNLETEYLNRRNIERKETLLKELEDVKGIIKDINQTLKGESLKEDNFKKELNDITGELKKVSEKIMLKERELKELFSKLSPDFAREIEAELKILEAESKEISLKPEKQKIKIFEQSFSSFITKVKKYLKANDLSEREKVEKSLSDLKSLKEDFVTKLNQKNVELLRLEAEVNSNKEKLKDLTEKEKELQNEMLLLEKNTGAKTDISVEKKMETELVSIVKEIEALEEKYKKLNQTFLDRQNEILIEKDKIQKELSEIRNEIHIKEVTLNNRKHILENQEKELRASESRLEEIKSKLTTVEKEGQGGSSELSKLLETKKAELNKIDLGINKLRDELSQIIEKEKNYSKQIFENEREIRSKEYEIASLRQELSGVEVEEAKISVRKEDIDDEVSLLHLPFESIKSEIMNDNERLFHRSKIDNLKRRLETIGDVDQETQEEYSELSLRHEESSIQLEDLLKAKEDLEKIIKELDDRIKNQFTDSFKIISTEFNRYFKILFDGGVANLSLEKETERGDLGIEITACPPGKRVKSLNALSGGERTLTSLALLFAILSVNPSPFVVLDEVDAALDETNTKRFLKIIEDISHKTQFIVITHNRETMKVASTLYGVTMDENHVSKILSLKMSEVESKVK